MLRPRSFSFWLGSVWAGYGSLKALYFLAEPSGGRNDRVYITLELGVSDKSLKMNCDRFRKMGPLCVEWAAWGNPGLA